MVVRWGGLRSLVLVTAAVLSVAAACRDDGRDLAEATEPATTVPPAAETPLTELTLASPDFADEGTIPVELTCDGAGRSPAMEWTGVPAEAGTLALVIDDPDADNFVHWVVTGIAPENGGVDAGQAPAGAVQAANSAGSLGWTPICPPPGETHTYVFTLYVLATPLGLEEGTDGAAAIERVAELAIGSASITATYTRP